MSEWKEYKLGEICDVRDGTHDSPKESPLGYPLVTSKNIKNGVIDLSNTYLISESDYNFVNQRSKVEQWDVLFSMIGTIGECAIVKEQPNYAIKNVGLFKTDGNRLLSEWIYYYFHSQQAKNEINACLKGSTQQYISLTDLRNFPIEIPSNEDQHKIVSILTSLDDKIDILRRENATLEAMAETLFRQWFVVEAKEDWEEGKLGDWVVIKRGGSPRPINDYLSPTGYRWLKISDVTNLNSPYIFQTKEYIKENGLSKTVYLKEGSLVLSNSATPGIPKILCIDSCIHDGWLYFPKSTFSKIYLYLLFKYIRNDLVNLGNGSIFTNLKTDLLKEYKVDKPDAKTLESFDHHVQPIFDKLYSNDIQIKTLIQTRDGLLPRLMDGEIKV